MDQITKTAEAAYQGVLAYVKYHGTDTNSIQARLILATLDATVYATGGLPPGTAPTDQRGVAADAREEAIQEERTEDTLSTQSGVAATSRSKSGANTTTTSADSARDTDSRGKDRCITSESDISATTSTSEATCSGSATQASAAQALTTTAQSQRAANSGATQSTVSSTSTATSKRSSASGASTATESPPANTTTCTTTPSSDSASKQGLHEKHHTRDSPAPENVFDRSELSEKDYSDKCFRVTNSLCRWLERKSTQYNSLNEMGLEAFEDHSKVVNGSPRYRIKPISGLKKMADIIYEHQVPLQRWCLDELKWMLDYRKAETTSCMRDSSKDGEEDEAHDHFNDMVREVYKVLKHLPSGQNSGSTSVQIRSSKSSPDSNAEASKTESTTNSGAQSASDT